MKKMLCMFIVIIFCFLFFSCVESKTILPKEDVSNESYRLYKVITTTYNENKENITFEIEYNEDGLVTNERTRKNDGREINKTNLYDQNGRLISEEFCWEDEKYNYTFSYQEDENGYTGKTDIVSADGISTYIETKYNKNFQCLSYELYKLEQIDNEFSVYSGEYHEYYGNGKIKTSKEIRTDNGFTSEIIATYDEKSRVIAQEVLNYANDDPSDVTTTSLNKYTYKNDKLYKEEYFMDIIGVSSQYILEQQDGKIYKYTDAENGDYKLKTYDTDDNLLSEESYDSEGVLNTKTIYQYVAT